MTVSAFTKDLPQCTVQERYPMKAATTFKVGGPADVLFDVSNGSALITLIQRLKEADMPFFLIGCGSNLLVADEGLRCAVLRFDTKYAAIERLGDNTLRCDAGVSLAKLSRFAQQQGLTGLEFACGIPGSVGGGLYMNAGAYNGEMVQVVKQADVLLPNGDVVTLNKQDLALTYRHSALAENGGIVLSATFELAPANADAVHERMAELLRARREKQPLEYPSAGSFFKRPEGHFAGKLIQDAGLKGYRVGDAQVSEKHAGFVINRGEATCEQIKQLEKDVRTKIWEQFGVAMTPEVRIMGTTWLA